MRCYVSAERLDDPTYVNRFWGRQSTGSWAAKYRHFTDSKTSSIDRQILPTPQVRLRYRRLTRQAAKVAGWADREGHGGARQARARQGVDGIGTDGQGKAGGARHGTAGLGAARQGQAGMAWKGEVRLGQARHGVARHGRRGRAGPGRAGLGVAWLGAAWGSVAFDATLPNFKHKK